MQCVRDGGPKNDLHMYFVLSSSMGTSAFSLADKRFFSQRLLVLGMLVSSTAG